MSIVKKLKEMNDKKPKDKIVSVYLDKPLLDKLDNLCNKTGLSRTALMKSLLELA